MSIPLGIKAGLIAAGLFALSPKNNTDTTGKGAVTNFLVNIIFKRIHSLKSGVLTIIYNINVKNPTPQLQTLTNGYLLLQVSTDKGMNWRNIGASDNKVAKIDVPAGNSKPLATEFPLLINLTASFSALLSKSNKYRIVFRYTYNGVEKQTVQSYDFTSALQKIPGFSGIEHIHNTPNNGSKRAIIRNVIIQIKQVYPNAFAAARPVQQAGGVAPQPIRKPQPQRWAKRPFYRPLYKVKQINPNATNRTVIPAKLLQVLKPGMGEASPLV